MLDTIATNNVEDPGDALCLPPLDLGSTFHQYFEIVPALSNALKDEVYRVRHQVYCEDLKFESARPDGLETDEHDPSSLHLLLRSVKTGEFIGCTRIVRPRPDDSRYHLPFERPAPLRLTGRLLIQRNYPVIVLPRYPASRLLRVIGDAKGKLTVPVSLADEDSDIGKSRRFPYIPLGLYLGTTELARISGIDTLFVLTERRQAAHFSKLGVQLRIIGKAIEHRGERVPAVMNVTSIVTDMRTIFHSLYYAIAADIQKAVFK